MKTTFVLIALVLLAISGAMKTNKTRKRRLFPRDFLFGAGSAAYQIEGAWNVDDKGESIWDHLTHRRPWEIVDQSNGNVAADSYHYYKRDVQIMRELGLNVYRFSISWSRVLPNGFSNRVSSAGLEFYDKYINEMLKYKITPMVTLYHWDLPQKLQELGGWVNPLIVDWFEDYARVVFSKFADRVKFWVTINDPKQICSSGYSGIGKAPQINAVEVGEYLCAKNILLAHAKAYYVYNDYFKPKYDGVCGISIGVNWFAPASSSKEDKLAAKLFNQDVWGLYADPIYSTQGGFPKELSRAVAEQSKKLGYARSRLPGFNDDEEDLIKGSYDFFGVNHYTAAFINAVTRGIPNADIQCEYTVPAEWPQSASNWLRRAPNSLLNTLNFLNYKYNDTDFYITENGWSTRPNESLEDDDRIRYIRAALENVLDSLDKGVPVKGYMVWSLMDSFEWMKGYTERFGLYEVDFTEASRPRMPRKSAAIYKHIINNRYINYSFKPKNSVLKIEDDIN